MTKILALILSASLLGACATTTADITPEQAYDKQLSNFKRLEWLIGTDSARRYLEDPRRPYIPVDNKPVTPADQAKYGFDTRIYDYLGEESDGLIYAVIKDPRDDTYRSGYLFADGRVAIPFRFGHTNKDHLSSRAFFNGHAAVINYAKDAQIYREEGASHPADQYAIIDQHGQFIIQYTAYTDIQRYPGDTTYTAQYIDETGQKRTSIITEELKIRSDYPGWSNR